MNIDTLRQRFDGVGQLLENTRARARDGLAGATGRVRNAFSPRGGGYLGPVIGAGTIVVVVAAGALAYDASRTNLITAGTKVAGVDVGNMTPAAASLRLDRTLSGPLARPVYVNAAGRQFVFSPEQSQIHPQGMMMAQAALTESRGSNFVSRTVDNAFDVGAANLPPSVSYSPQAVDALVATVKKQVDQPARDATVKPSASSISIVPQSDGNEVDGNTLSKDVTQQLENPGPDRTVQAPIVVTHPRVTADQLPAQYPTYILIDRSNFTLRFFKNLKLAKSYEIAVGQAGLETPAGVHYVDDKQVNPSWHVPNSSWAGDLAGQVIPPGPRDPIKARWMGIGSGDGIHGTDETGSLGTAGSHGCIRMAIPDVIELYPQVPVHTPVFVG